MKLWPTFRRKLLSIALPITKFFGHLHAPFSHKLVSGADYLACRKQVQKGAVLISRIRGEFSNNFIPGFFTHAAMYYGGPDELVIEAVGTGVRIVSLAEFLFTKDYVALLVPTFMPSEKLAIAAEVANNLIGTPYDFFFEATPKAFYCSELVQFSYDTVMPTGSMPFTKRETLGVPTVIPHDYWCAREKFDVLWSNLNKNKELK